MSQATVTPNTFELGYVKDVYSAEDFAHISGTKWLVTSGMAGPNNQGHLYAVDIETKVASEIFPTGGDNRPDASAYDNVEPPDLNDFSAVGVALREGSAGLHTLYVVNHGGRAAIEVFEIDATGSAPRAAWVGVIPLPKGVWGNAVALLADGGLLATNFMSTEDPEAVSKVLAGEDSGNVMEWHPGGDWVDVPGTECCSPNGVDVSGDGEWIYIDAWSPKRVIKVSRGRTPVERTEIDVPLLPDNIKLTPRGLLVTGQTSDAATVFEGIGAGPTFDVGGKVLSIDPDTLAAEELLSFDDPGGFGTAATALEIDGTIWVSSARSDCLTYFEPA
jgi:hypothetical protein